MYYFSVKALLSSLHVVFIVVSYFVLFGFNNDDDFSCFAGKLTAFGFLS